jgi:hypothetical protein
VARSQELRLEVREFRDLTRWRWVLSEAASGALVADHEVRLDATDWQFEAFRGLHHYLAWHVAPDRRGTDEARIVAEVGEWISTRVLGPVADALVRQASRRHVTVRVVVPDVAGELLLAPLELARADGRPLALQGVTLIMQPNPTSALALFGSGCAYWGCSACRRVGSPSTCGGSVKRC